MARITKSMAEKMLEDVPKEKRFWCRDGQVLRNMQELETALREMTEEAFCYHSNETKNDFSNWVRDVIGDEKLSRDLLKSSTRAQAAKSVASRVTWLMSKMATE
jgi:hypothetical protein